MADYTVSFTEMQERAVQAIVDEHNAKFSGDQIDIPIYLQRRANQLADNAIYQYSIAPTAEEYQEVVAENTKLKAQLGAIKSL